MAYRTLCAGATIIAEQNNRLTTMTSNSFQKLHINNVNAPMAEGKAMT